MKKHPLLDPSSLRTLKAPVKDRLLRPLQDLRISVIDRCNFRCPYCMPEKEFSQHYKFLQEKEWLTFAEVTRLTKLLVRLGVTKVRLTGGEPLLRPHLADLIQQLITIPEIEDLALTTNGSLLAENVEKLRLSGLKRLTVSLDTLDPKIFKTMSGQKSSLENVLQGIQAADKAGFTAIKINVVVKRGINDHTVLDLVEHFRGTPHIVRFIEYMDVGNCNHWALNSVVPSSELVKMIHARYPLEPLEANYYGEVASRYRYKDGKGEIGFVSSISQPFCQSCTRARLSTDGQLFTCLFASQGKDLRTPLRNRASDEALLDLLTQIWRKREDRYSELRTELLKQQQSIHKVEMFQIGG